MYFTFGSIATVAAIVIIQPTLEIIGKPEFLANLNLFYVLLAAQLTCVLAEFGKSSSMRETWTIGYRLALL